MGDLHSDARGDYCEYKDVQALESQVKELEGALVIAGVEIEAYLGYCPAEQEDVPWDCEKKCATEPAECSAQCWTDWFKHKSTCGQPTAVASKQTEEL